MLAVAALIAYGSLYPFNLKPEAIHNGVLEAVRELSWARAGRSDRIANVLLYIPFGFCLLLWLGRSFRRASAVVIAVIVGTLLSLVIEVAQVYISSRVPSLMDLTLNALGTLVGATAGVAWDRLGGLMRLPSRVEKPHRDPSAALLVALWLLWRFAPFVPHLDLGKLKAALAPLFRPHIELATTLVFLTYWLVISQAVARLVSRAHTLEGLLLTIAAVLVGRLIVANQSFVPSELLALVLLLPIVVLMYRMTLGAKRLLLVGSILAVFLFERLAPFTFSPSERAFDFWPFMAIIDAGWRAGFSAIDWTGLFAAIFLFAALLWTLRYAGTSFRLAAGIMLALVLTTEIVQMWLVDRTGSITDPVLAVAVIVAFRYTQRPQRRLFKGTPANRREHSL
jgi:VanZ family protein